MPSLTVAPSVVAPPRLVLALLACGFVSWMAAPASSHAQQLPGWGGPESTAFLQER
jgi:hypothetical protein